MSARTVCLSGPLAFFLNQLHDEPFPGPPAQLPSPMSAQTASSTSQLASRSSRPMTYFSSRTVSTLTRAQLISTAHCMGKTKPSAPINIQSSSSSSSSSSPLSSSISSSAPQRFLNVPEVDGCRRATDPGLGFVNEEKSDTDAGVSVIHAEETSKKSYWSWKSMMPSTNMRPKDLNILAPTSL